MKYKIYTIEGITESTIKQVMEDKEFEYEDFDTMEEAFEQIKKRGVDFCNYTVLPYIFMT